MTGRKKELIKYEIHGRIVECEPDETLKYEVADELGLLDKVIGGIIGRIRKNEDNNKSNAKHL